MNKNKKFVFTIREEICTANNKDVNATDLLSVMKKYGVVEEFSVVESAIRAECQSTIDGLTTQISAIKDQELTADEFKIVKSYRECKASNDAEHIAKINELVQELKAVKVENEQRVSRIKEALGD